MPLVCTSCPDKGSGRCGRRLGGARRERWGGRGGCPGGGGEGGRHVGGARRPLPPEGRGRGAVVARSPLSPVPLPPRGFCLDRGRSLLFPEVSESVPVSWQMGTRTRRSLDAAGRAGSRSCRAIRRSASRPPHSLPIRREHPRGTCARTVAPELARALAPEDGYCSRKGGPSVPLLLPGELARRCAWPGREGRTGLGATSRAGSGFWGGLPSPAEGPRGRPRSSASRSCLT